MNTCRNLKPAASPIYPDRNYIPRYSTEATTARNLDDQQRLKDFYYFRAVQQWNWASSKPDTVRALTKRYGITPYNIKEGIMEWYNELHYCPITYPQLIPIREWDWEGLAGTSENQLLHHHYHRIEEMLLQLPEKEHEILIMFECSNKKPYNSARHYKWYMRALCDHCDFALADYGIIPMGWSEMYPYVADEWDHFSEGKYMHDLYNWYSKDNFKRVMDSWKYKEVVVVIQHHSPREWLVELAKDDPRIHIILDDKFDTMMRKKYYDTFHSNGVIISRTMNLPETRIHLLKKIIPIIKKVEGKDPKHLRQLLKACQEGAGKVGSEGLAYRTQKLIHKKAPVEYPADQTINRKMDTAKMNYLLTDYPMKDTITSPISFDELLNNNTTPCSTVLQYLHDKVESGEWELQKGIHNDYWGLRYAITNHKDLQILDVGDEYEQGYIFYDRRLCTEEECWKVARKMGWLKKNVRKREPKCTPAMFKHMK